jgi:uncharacterized membrane protein YhhN
MNKQNLFKVFLAVSGLYLIGLVALPESPILFYAKFALLPILLLVARSDSGYLAKNLLLLALFFSWVGDVIIAYAKVRELYFLLGLAAFLIAHVCYIFLFRSSVSQYKQHSAYPKAAYIALGLYLVGFLTVLFPTLGGLKIPVMVYACVIGAMLGMSMYGLAHWPRTPGLWILVGAASFVMSDSILAFNKFYTPIPLASLWIMSTYLFAQYAITRGSTELK